MESLIEKRSGYTSYYKKLLFKKLKILKIKLNFETLKNLN